MDIKFDKCYFESNKALNTARNATGGAVWLRSNGTADILVLPMYRLHIVQWPIAIL